jgi:hypothetical protein
MAGLFGMQGPSNMVSSFLTPKSDFISPPKPFTSPFSGTSLGSPFTPGMFGPSKDYGSIFNQAAATPVSRGGASSGELSPLPKTIPGPKMTSRPGVQPRLGGGGGLAPGAISQAAPTEFYLGPAPELKGLNIDWQEMGKRAMEANAPYREQFQAMTPGLEAGIKANLATAQQQIAGQLPRDVAQQIARSSAAAGLRGGYGAGGMGRNLTARDFGLSSLQLQQSGADLLARSSALAQQAMQAQSPISPTQVFSEALAQASANQQLANQNLLNAWQNKPLPGQFDISRGQYVGYRPGTYSALKPLTPDQEDFNSYLRMMRKKNPRFIG